MPEDLNNNGHQNDDAEAAIAERINKAVEEATAGLKRTNNELKGEKTSIKEQMDALNQTVEQLGGLDVLKQLGSGEAVKQILEMQKRFQADEQGKLLSEGKYDEWFDKRTAALRKDHENQIKNLQTQLEEQKSATEKANTLFRSKVLETDVSAASLDAGVETSAMMDIRLRAEHEFNFDPELNRFVLKDKEGGVVYGKDGSTPKTIREWIEDQKETSRHWWPPSKGGGIEGSGRPGDKTSLEKLDMRAYGEARKKQGFKAF